MTVIENRPALDIRSNYETDLQVEREDISFETIGEKVRIRVTVRNSGARLSRPSFMHLQSAPLGAFVPWRPLGVLSIPELAPGESYEAVADVQRPRPEPLMDSDRVPPKRVMTALSSPEQPEPKGDSLRQEFLRERAEILKHRDETQVLSSFGKSSARTDTLAPDLWDLAGRRQPHWAGNINVFVCARAVERHFARALRIYPGRRNLAMFLVGGPRLDAYAFELQGLGPDWNAVLYDRTLERVLVSGAQFPTLEERRWIESRGGLGLTLQVEPPDSCPSGNLQVHVTQRSSGKTAIVEFDLDAKAQGPGCYVV